MDGNNPIVPTGSALSNKSAALDSVSELLKLSTGFAAGSLVFSRGLIGTVSSLFTSARVLLFGAWFALVVSILAGGVAYSRVVILKAARNFDVDDLALTWPARVSVAALLLGIGCLGTTVLLTGFREPRVASATKALALAEKCLPRGTLVRRVATVESIKSIDGARPSGSTWHVQFETTPQLSATVQTIKPATTRATRPSVYLDVFVNADNGAAATLSDGPCPNVGNISSP